MNKKFLEQLTDMAVFTKVVELKGFSAAAAQVGITKSTVSKQVTRLERRLGVKLLHRTTRTLSLTEAGVEFYHRAEQAIALAENAETAVSQLTEDVRGSLRITAPVAFGKLCIAPLIPEFLVRYPEVRVHLSLLDRFVDLAEEGYDLAIRLTRKLPEQVVARRLLPIRHIICAAPAYLEGRAVPRVPQDLARFNCLYYGYGEFGDRWVFKGTVGQEAVRVTGNFVVNSSEAIRDALLKGVGIGMLPAFIIAQELRAGQLHALLPGWEPEGPFAANAYVVWLPNRFIPPKTRVFIDYLVQRLEEIEPPGVVRS